MSDDKRPKYPRDIHDVIGTLIVFGVGWALLAYIRLNWFGS